MGPAVDFGRALRRARRAQGLSQDRLAERADLDRTHISHIERGAVKWPRSDVAFALLIALGLDIQTFWAYMDSPEIE